MIAGKGVTALRSTLEQRSPATKVQDVRLSIYGMTNRLLVCWKAFESVHSAVWKQVHLLVKKSNLASEICEHLMILQCKQQSLWASETTCEHLRHTYSVQAFFSPLTNEFIWTSSAQHLKQTEMRHRKQRASIWEGRSLKALWINQWRNAIARLGDLTRADLTRESIRDRFA